MPQMRGPTPRYDSDEAMLKLANTEVFQVSCASVVAMQFFNFIRKNTQNTEGKLSATEHSGGAHSAVSLSIYNHP